MKKIFLFLLSIQFCLGSLLAQTKINKELGYKPSVTFEEGLSLTINWYLSNKEWLDNITTDKCEQEDIYYAFQLNDWRYGSCGGCI